MDTISAIIHSNSSFILAMFIVIVVASAGFAWAVSTIIFEPIFSQQAEKRKNVERMSHNISDKIKSGAILTAKDIVYIGRGFDLSPQSSRDAIFKLYADTTSTEEITAIKPIILELERDEPFDEFPDEVKSSLYRISKIVEQSNNDSDKYILSPITTALSKYVELRTEWSKLKKQTQIAFIITIVSLFIGAISFYFTLKSPSGNDIKEIIEQSCNHSP